MAKTHAPYRVAAITLDGFALMSYAATVEPLRAANLLSGQNLYDIINVPVVQDANRPAQSSGGASLQSGAEIGSRAHFDLALVIAGGNATQVEHRKLANWLARLSRGGTHIGGVSAGPLFLARSGLLDGYRMTVHWEHADMLLESFPDQLF